MKKEKRFKLPEGAYGNDQHQEYSRTIQTYVGDSTADGLEKDMQNNGQSLRHTVRLVLWEMLLKEDEVLETDVPVRVNLPVDLYKSVRELAREKRVSAATVVMELLEKYYR